MEQSGITIKIDTQGDVYFLYNDHSPLRDMGKMELTRASNVHWADEEQGWKVIYNDPTGNSYQIGDIFTDRVKAIQFEIEFLNKKMDSIAVEKLFESKLP